MSLKLNANNCEDLYTSLFINDYWAKLEAINMSDLFFSWPIEMMPNFSFICIATEFSCSHLGSHHEIEAPDSRASNRLFYGQNVQSIEIEFVMKRMMTLHIPCLPIDFTAPAKSCGSYYSFAKAKMRLICDWKCSSFFMISARPRYYI